MATGIYCGLMFLAGSQIRGATRISIGWPVLVTLAFDIACVAALLRYAL